MQKLDAIQWVKNSQIRFFPDGQIDVLRLLAYVMADVIGLGGGDCHITRRSDWWFVSSDVDWLTHPSIPVPQLFSRVVPAPAHGEHSMRAEVLVAAYAEDVYTMTATEAHVIKGAGPDVVAAAAAELGATRVVAFRLLS
jgi:hypothetical protein